MNHKFLGIGMIGITLGITQRIKTINEKKYCVTFCTFNICKGKSRYKSTKYFGESKGKDSFSKHDSVCMAYLFIKRFC